MSNNYSMSFGIDGSARLPLGFRVGPSFATLVRRGVQAPESKPVISKRRIRVKGIRVNQRMRVTSKPLPNGVKK